MKIFTNQDVLPSIGQSYVINRNGEPMLTYYRPNSGIFCETPLQRGDVPYFLNIRRPIVIDVNDMAPIVLPQTLPSKCDGIILKNYGSQKIMAFFVRDKDTQAMSLEQLINL